MVDIENDIERNYELLTMDEIDKEREQKIEEFIQYSDLSKAKAELVLMNNNWNIDILMNECYDNNQKIMEKSGIAQTPESQKKLDEYFKEHKISKNKCLVCHEDVEPENIVCLECNHQFCSNCFKEYLKEKTKEPLTLLSTKCPMQFCNFQVNSEIIKKMFADQPDEMNIYKKCLIRNFTESNADIKLCPNPKCDLFIKLPGHGMEEINCYCGKIFCFKCLRDGHRPCDCEMIQIWEEKIKNEGENTKLFLANIKQCPKCHRDIEKNQGCNHMTCKKEAGGCGYEFCWVCLGEWKPHDNSYYECKKYTQKKEENKELKENDMKLELDRFANYYEGYREEEKAIEYALKLEEKIGVYKKELEVVKHEPHIEVLFLDDALRTVIECHRILKNTYIYGYFMKILNNNISLFVYQQELLRKNADLLHNKIEMNYIYEIIVENNYELFNRKYQIFKGEILSLIAATNKFKENFLNEIEKHPEYIDFDLFKN